MSRGFVQCASFRQPQPPAQRADGLLSDGRGLGLAERTLFFGRKAAAVDFPKLKCIQYGWICGLQPNYKNGIQAPNQLQVRKKIKKSYAIRVAGL